MAELFDTRGVSDDDEHWDALAERVASQAMSRSRRASVGSIAASRAAPLAAVLLFAASLAFMAMSLRQRAQRSSAVLGPAIAPGDDVGRAIALTGSPPSVVSLLLDQPGGEGGQP